jgi:hypothetical protein
MWYKVDFDKLILLLLPTLLRKPRLFGYLKALISPLSGGSESLYARWSDNRFNNINKLQYNSQRCYLRGALNDACDFFQRRIRIEGAPELDSTHIYTEEENLDIYLDTVFLDLDFSENGEPVDFVVYVPEDVMPQINKIIALLDFYTLAGKIYKIVILP